MFHIFNFVGRRDGHRRTVIGKNHFDIIVIDNDRLDKSVNQPVHVFLKPKVEVTEFVKRKENKLLCDLRYFVFFRFDTSHELFFFGILLSV